MNRSMALALVIGGIVLLVSCFNAGQSIDSASSRFFTGSPTNGSLWMIIAGLAALLLGLFGLSRRAK